MRRHLLFLVMCILLCPLILGAMCEPPDTAEMEKLLPAAEKAWKDQLARIEEINGIEEEIKGGPIFPSDDLSVIPVKEALLKEVSTSVNNFREISRLDIDDGTKKYASRMIFAVAAYEKWLENNIKALKDVQNTILTTGDEKAAQQQVFWIALDSLIPEYEAAKKKLQSVK